MNENQISSDSWDYDAQASAASSHKSSLPKARVPKDNKISEKSEAEAYLARQQKRLTVEVGEAHQCMLQGFHQNTPIHTILLRLQSLAGLRDITEFTYSDFSENFTAASLQDHRQVSPVLKSKLREFIDGYQTRRQLYFTQEQDFLEARNWNRREQTYVAMQETLTHLLGGYCNNKGESGEIACFLAFLEEQKGSYVGEIQQNVKELRRHVQQALYFLRSGIGLLGAAPDTMPYFGK